MTNSGTEVRWEALQMIREDLREVGIDATVRRMEINAAVAAMTSLDFDAALTGLNADTSLDLSFVLHSAGIGEQFNFSAYSNPEVDRLIEQINRSGDSEEATVLARRVQQIVDRDQPMLFLWEPLGLTAASADLEHVEPNAVSLFRTLPYWSWR
jgi:peptide/nickel transport system substrate-binding protein